MAERKGKIYDRGLHHRRTLEENHQGPREKAFAEMWEKEAHGVLSAIFIPHSRMRSLTHPVFSGRPAIKITRLHRAMIATVVQWFGSNVGFSNLEEVLKKCGYTLIRTKDLKKHLDELDELQRQSRVRDE